MTAPRILVLGSYPALHPRHGGQVRLAELLRAYAARGFQVKQASYFPSRGFYTDRPLGEHDIGLDVHDLEAWRGIRAPLIEDLASGDLVAADETKLAALEAFSGEVDFVDLEHPWLLPVVDRLRERGRIGKFRLIYGSHNIEHALKRAIFAQYNVRHGEPLLEAIEALEKRSAREASLVGAVTADDAAVLRGWTEAPVIVAPNGIAPWASSQERRAAWREKLGDDPFALYVASGHPPNISGLCDCFGESLAPLSPVQKLVLAGGVGEHVVSTEWFKRWRVLHERRTVVTGLLSDEDLSAVRDLAHVFILPVTSGGGSNLKTAEALYSGRHVVATPMAMRGFEGLDDLPGVHIEPPGPGFGRAVSKALCQPLPAEDDAARRRRDSLTWTHTLAALCDGIERLAAS